MAAIFLIDCFATLLTATAEESDFYMFTAQIYTFLATKGYKYANLKRIIQRAVLGFSYTKHILIPSHVNGNHYVLMDVDVKAGKLIMYDSQLKADWDRMKVLRNVRQLIQDAIDCKDITPFYITHNKLEWKLID